MLRGGVLTNSTAPASDQPARFSASVVRLSVATSLSRPVASTVVGREVPLNSLVTLAFGLSDHLQRVTHPWRTESLGPRSEADLLCGCVEKRRYLQVRYRKNYRGKVVHRLGGLVSAGIARGERHLRRHRLTPVAPPDDPSRATNVPHIATSCSHELWGQSVARWGRLDSART